MDQTLIQLPDGTETTLSELKESQLASTPVAATQRVEPQVGAQFLAWEFLRERIVL